MSYKFIKKLDSWKSDARLYETDSPVLYEDGVTKYIIVSAVYVPFNGPETYVFPSNEYGVPINYIQLPGSYRGGLDHSKALECYGNEIP